MKKKSNYLASIYKNTTFLSLEEAQYHIKIDDKERADVLETGDAHPTFYTGELMIYRLNNNRYSGVIIDIYINDQTSTIYLIMKRLGISQLYDILIISSEVGSGMEVIFDKYSEGMHKSSKCNLSFGDMVDIITYNTGGVCGADLQQVADMMDALDELTDEKNPVTMH